MMQAGCTAQCRQCGGRSKRVASSCSAHRSSAEYAYDVWLAAARSSGTASSGSSTLWVAQLLALTATPTGSTFHTNAGSFASAAADSSRAPPAPFASTAGQPGRWAGAAE